MNRSARAQARSRAHAVLARLLLRGLEPGRVDTVRALPILREALPSRIDLDAIAAEHYELFHLQLPPVAGSYLHPQGLAGAEAAEPILQAYRRSGFAPKLDETSADHLGIMLVHLSFLAGTEAEALAEGRDEVAEHVAGLGRAFVAEHLMSWLPAWIAAVRDQPTGFWSAVAMLVWDLVSDQAAPAGPVPSPEGAPHGLEALLDRPSTGLRQIARALTVPLQCGLFLSRTDITAVARKSGCPRGFGDRFMMLENLLVGAAELGELPGVTAALQTVVSRRLESLHAVVSGRIDIDSVSFWIERMQATLDMLRRIERRVVEQKVG